MDMKEALKIADSILAPIWYEGVSNNEMPLLKKRIASFLLRAIKRNNQDSKKHRKEATDLAYAHDRGRQRQ